ncbi:hypothetical protein F5148DRAFT_90536 [Russula earlei]|uniref:Uncharacterized protein n=1 Tax=Russula earlei TaxID=71964 RepID=A0ACC0U7W4_9AGAM|nr:hypothetical protein F5148DRAFT_90536 [Russula earlei]
MEAQPKPTASQPQKSIQMDAVNPVASGSNQHAEHKARRLRGGGAARVRDVPFAICIPPPFSPTVSLPPTHVPQFPTCVMLLTGPRSSNRTASLAWWNASFASNVARSVSHSWPLLFPDCPFLFRLLLFFFFKFCLHVASIITEWRTHVPPL